MVDLEKYKDDLNNTKSEGSSPEKMHKEESEKHDTVVGNDSSQSSASKNLHDKIIEV